MFKRGNIMDEHTHKWISNSGQGGEPIFKVNKQMAWVPHMHVKCSLCNDRTWMSRATWIAWNKSKGQNVELRCCALLRSPA